MSVSPLVESMIFGNKPVYVMRQEAYDATVSELDRLRDENSRFRDALEMIVGDDPGCVYGKELDCTKNETVKTEWCVWCIARTALSKP